MIFFAICAVEESRTQCPPKYSTEVSNFRSRPWSLTSDL